MVVYKNQLLMQLNVFNTLQVAFIPLQVWGKNVALVISWVDFLDVQPPQVSFLPSTFAHLKMLGVGENHVCSFSEVIIPRAAEVQTCIWKRSWVAYLSADVSAGHAELRGGAVFPSARAGLAPRRTQHLPLGVFENVFSGFQVSKFLTWANFKYFSKFKVALTQKAIISFLMMKWLYLENMWILCKWEKSVE